MAEQPCATWVPTNPNIPHRERHRCTVKGPHTIHSAGLHERYRVEKVHDPEGKHADCRYFVLDPEHDPLARIALAAYADAADRVQENHGTFRRRTYLPLVRDLRAWLRKLGANQ